MNLVRLVFVLAIPVFAWCQFSSPNPDDSQQISAARQQYSTGRSFEEQGNYGSALAAYKFASAILSRRTEGSGYPRDPFGVTSLERRYANAAVLASSIDLDQARVLSFLGRASTDDYTLALAGSGENAQALFSEPELKAMGTCATQLWPGGPARLALVFYWVQPAVAGHKMVAFLNLGRMHLMFNELGAARDCFERALAIDRSNAEALQYVGALTNILAAQNARKSVTACEMCLTKNQKDLITAGISIGEALLTSRYPRGAPITSALLNYLNSRLPEKQ